MNMSLDSPAINHWLCTQQQACLNTTLFYSEDKLMPASSSGQHHLCDDSQHHMTSLMRINWQPDVELEKGSAPNEAKDKLNPTALCSSITSLNADQIGDMLDEWH